jgi:hypothetical protein
LDRTRRIRARGAPAQGVRRETWDIETRGAECLREPLVGSSTSRAARCWSRRSSRPVA